MSTAAAPAGIRVSSGEGWTKLSLSQSRPAGCLFSVPGVVLALYGVTQSFSRPESGLVLKSMALNNDRKMLGLAIMGLTWVLVGLIAFIQVVHIEVRDGALRIFHRPLPFSGLRLAPGSMIELAVETRIGKASHWCVVAKTSSGKTCDVLVLGREDTARFVQAELGRALGPGVKSS